MILKDEYYIDAVEERSRKEKVNAEYAVSRTEEELEAIFSSMEDSYISERPPISKMSQSGFYLF